ncbi:MAG: hypothetical protein U5K75_12145 [Ahrensia sp.]|nr:hypothetical protein [Ahrensia sp.]
MEVEFVGQSSRDSDNGWANTSRLINCYRERSGDGQSVIKSVLGLVPVSSIPSTFCRAMATINGVLYIAQGGKLYSLASNGMVSSLGVIKDSPYTSISGNNGKITIVADNDYYVLNNLVLSTPATGAFSEFGSVTFYKQLTVLTEANGRRIQWSAVANPLSLNGLDFASAESRDDKIIRALPIAGSLWVFKETSIERWAVNSSGDLQSIVGSEVGNGLKSFRLITEFPNGAAFVGDDNKVRIAPGMQVVSTPAVETSIVQDKPDSVFYYQDEGHEFIVLTFSDRPAWVFDLFSGEWHERATGKDGPWAIKASSNAYGNFYACGDDGELQYFARTNADASIPLIRTAIGRTIENEGSDFKVINFQIRANVGRSTSVEPFIDLLVSKDRGKTWVDPRPRSAGKVGQYKTRIKWLALGRFKQFTPQISWADPVDINIGSVAFMETA